MRLIRSLSLFCFAISLPSCLYCKRSGQVFLPCGLGKNESQKRQVFCVLFFLTHVLLHLRTCHETAHRRGICLVSKPDFSTTTLDWILYIEQMPFCAYPPFRWQLWAIHRWIRSRHEYESHLTVRRRLRQLVTVAVIALSWSWFYILFNGKCNIFTTHRGPAIKWTSNFVTPQMYFAMWCLHCVLSSTPISWNGKVDCPDIKVTYQLFTNEVDGL